MGSLTKLTECSVLLSSPPWWPAPWQPSSPPPPLSPSKSARLRRPPAATSQFLMTELLLAKLIVQPPAQWPGPRRALSTLQRLPSTPSPLPLWLLTPSSTRLRFGAHKKITSSGGRVHSKVLLMKPPQQVTRSVHSAVLSSPMRLEIRLASLGR